MKIESKTYLGKIDYNNVFLPTPNILFGGGSFYTKYKIRDNVWRFYSADMMYADVFCPFEDIFL